MNIEKSHKILLVTKKRQTKRLYLPWNSIHNKKKKK